MAKIYISEYKTITRDDRSAMLPAGQEPALAEQSVSIGGSSVQSEPFSVNTRFVRINTDSACSVAFGDDPVALNTAKRLSANSTEYFGVKPGQRVAVISNT